MFPVRPWLIAALLMSASLAKAKEAEVVADAGTQMLLRRAEFEQIEISPNGSLLAIARRMPGGTVVEVQRRADMQVITSIDPGKDGEVDTLQWLDNDRLLIGANRADGLIGVPMVDPALYIVRADGKDTFKLPANFVATIDGDADHLLVSNCGHSDKSGCLLEIRRAEIAKLRRIGELVIAAPDVHTNLLTDRKGNVRFAMGWEDDGTGKTYVHNEGKEGWTLINDSAKTGLDVVPLSVAPDSKTGFLISEREHGTDAIESYDFATGKRTEVFRDANSDPLHIVRSVDGREPIGAIFNPTQPQLHFWNAQSPDALLIGELQKAFPGKISYVVSATSDGMMLVIFTAGDRDPGTFYLLDRRTSKASLLAHAKPWLNADNLGKQQAFELKARDGKLLHGVLTLPPRADGRNLPMIVLPHGGPYGVLDSFGYDAEAQILATHGYAVLQVNFRGSGGYGREFLMSGMMQWGRAMQDDVTDATHWAIAQGIADGHRVCIYGASYGGYAAMMGAVREPGLYRCAAGLSGVFDLAKMYKWGSIRRSDLGMEYLKHAIGQDKVELAARSPVQQADKITVPVLLAHGKWDGRVDIIHARALKRALSKAGHPAELIEYEYEGHGLAQEPHQRDFYARLLEFVGKYIGPTAAAANVAAAAQ